MRHPDRRAGRRSPGPSLAPLLAFLLLAASPARAHAPHDEIHLVALSPAFDTDRTLLAFCRLTDRAVFARSVDGGRTFEIFASRPSTVLVSDLVLSPDWTQDATAFAASSDEGLWRSTDGGDSWVDVGAGTATEDASQVAMSPGFARDGLVLAATAGGLFRSVDRGDSWTQVTAGLTESAVGVVRFAADGTAFAGDHVLHRSDDGGTTWTAVQDFGSTLGIDQVVPSPSFAGDGTVAVCFGRQGGGIQVSADGGTIWSPANDGLADLRVRDVGIASDGTAFAVTQSAACYRASAVTGRWTLYDDGFTEPSPLTDDHYPAVAVSPGFARAGVVFVASYEGLFRSDDGGLSWRQQDVYSQRLNRRLVVSPGFAADGRVYAGNFGGGPYLWEQVPAGPPGRTSAPWGSGSSSPPAAPVDTTADVGPGGPAPAPDGPPGRWSALGQGVGTLFTSALAVSPAFATDGTLYYGYTSLWRSRDRGRSWSPLPLNVNAVRGLVVSPDFERDATLFAGSGKTGTFRSTDGGDTWQMLSGGLPGVRTTVIALSPAFATDPTVFHATHDAGVWRSLDGGDAWSDVTGSIPTDKIRSLAVSPDFVADGTVLAGTIGAGLHRTLDRGLTWSLVEGLPSGGTDVVNAIAFSPDYASDRTVFVVSAYDGIFRSVDGGTSWTEVPPVPTRSGLRGLALSPDFPADPTLFVASYDWSWRSVDGGTSWSRLPGRVRVDDSHDIIATEGEWMGEQLEGSYGLGVSVATRGGAWREHAFAGDTVAWYGARGPLGGVAEFVVDGTFVGSVDLYAPEDEPPEAWFTWTFGGPAEAWHVVRVAVSETASPQGGGRQVRSDGFLYTF